MKKDSISILNFVKEQVPYLFNKNEKFRKWVEQPTYLKVYEEVPEHAASINFILSNLIIDGIEDIDYWTLQRIGLDFLVYGGFTNEIQKLRGGGYKLNYLDIGKCRLNPDKDKIGYADNWTKYNVEIKWKPIAENVTEDGIYYFKNNKSRGDYPTPYYYAALKSLDTMSLISEYHNNNAKCGFSPTVIVNFNNGDPDEDIKKEIEEKTLEKFTGAKGQKVILSFNENEQTKTTFDKLKDDNLDKKFAELQKFIQGQIIISHQITSGQLIGVKPESQGFSQTEYVESMKIFEEVVIASLRRELEYALSKMLNKDVKLKTNSEKIQNIPQEIKNNTTQDVKTNLPIVDQNA